MEKTVSFLFSGANFDKNKFASDFSRFKDKKEAGNSVDDSEPEEKIVSVKRRKRKAMVSDRVGGFNVFKSAKKASVVSERTDLDNDEVSKRKKELNRQIEQDALFRKKHNIHVSGNSVVSPLKKFAELFSRYGCESYLLQNIADLGFQELTPIQRQVIPVLLSVRECFACAPTGSGKTLAFVCPMLMKLKVLFASFNHYCYPSSRASLMKIFATQHPSADGNIVGSYISNKIF
ncbi:DEAD-box ATP-dependent RNA helicase 57-like isoform X2 [Tripterygium wilfordii]|uniref:DEAD-box ATP-dependent RNA helicase 57-like isoform X2 n=1 Tax=Tripterygium wilfordii TaxID=458696 RepID=UPI0018F82AA8|nr:DEAD-box ATP-dependent RNA helicase 57-like isoform X2 [Tripterygium wilfordii]